VHRTADLLEPIYHALLSAILQSAVLAMDETPLKAGRRGKGKLHTGYFWPLYGDQDEVAFPFAASRAQSVGREARGSFCGVLVTDGSIVYDRFVQTVNRLVHAQGWSHTRRHFLDAERAEPALVTQALDFIRALYEHEAQIRQQGLTEDTKLAYRAEYAKPLGDAFFAWLEQTLTTHVLLPANPFTQAARYALEREPAVRVLLENPNVPLATNHLEREIRALALGRRNWLFCWTEGGRGMSASCRACSRPAAYKGWSPTSTWSMCCSASIPIPPLTFISSPRGCGNSTSPLILFVPISIASVNNAKKLPLTSRWQVRH
jgi:transposase